MQMISFAAEEHKCKPCVPTASPSFKGKCCPRSWVEVTPAFFQGSPADHTYVKTMDRDEKCKSWSCFGADAGGKYLEGTEAHIQNSNIPFIEKIVDQPPCKWPVYLYLVVGVCHQLANRGIYHTGKTVLNARVYGLTSFIYGTYGTCLIFLQDYCFENCPGKSGPWEPGAPPECESTIQSLSTISNFERLVYDKYFLGEGIRDKAGYSREWYQRYRNEWLMMNIRFRLGKDFSSKKALQLQELRNQMLKKKHELDAVVVRKKSADDMAEKYNLIYNELLKNSKKVLSVAEYERFFTIEYGKEFDIRVFRPK
jgi:hypothetical protein